MSKKPSAICRLGLNFQITIQTGKLVATQLLFYDTAIPLNQQRHGTWSVEVGEDFGFSRNTNSVPLMTVEFIAASIEYPVVFIEADGVFSPVVVLGIKTNQNLYLTGQAAWNAKYIPAFVRRYPFVFSSNDDGSQFTLCIDESFPGFNQADKGARLFDDNGKPTQYVQNVLSFLQGYQNEHLRTQKFSQHLHELGLLEPMQAQITLDTGSLFSLSGFFCVNRDRLKNLPAEKLVELAKSDELELIYAHLHSLKNFEMLNERLRLSDKSLGSNIA
jgi:hypothetical protein